MIATPHQCPGDPLAALRPENVRPAPGRGIDDGRGENSSTAAWSLDALPANVVPLARGRAGDAAKRLGIVAALDPAARPVPLAPTEKRARLAAFVMLSLLLHAALYAAFWEEPKPLASVGIEAITVDLMLGGNTEAGIATTPGETEAQAPAPADEVKPEEEAAEQQERAAEARPETPVAERELPSDEVTEAKPERKPTTVVAPSDAASGIGRGRSDSDTHYRGLVAAHLTRHKQYPAVARRNRDQGTASVSFTIDGSGRVTVASLVRGSGHASLDQEVQAMVRRASPFPPPPGGRAMSFTVPVTFRLQ